MNEPLQHQQIRVTIRKRKDKQFIPYWFSQFPVGVENVRSELQDHIPDAFITYEPHRITLGNGREIAQRHVLWVPPDDLKRYKAWQNAQQQLLQEKIDQAREQRKDGYGLLRDLTLDEVQTATSPLVERPKPRPLQSKKTPKREREPPAWMLNLPSVLRDGNGNEYHYPAQIPEATMRDVPELYTPDIPITPAAAQPVPPVAKRSPSTIHKGITRADYTDHQIRGYYAVVTWKKVTQRKYFADKHYGDQLAAFDAAIEWRNSTEKKLGKPRTEVQIKGVTRSNTGYQGITECTKEGRYHVFEVVWQNGEGKVYRSQVSIDKWGRKEALRKAKRIRLQRLKERIRSNEGKKF